MAFGEVTKYSFSYYAMFDEHRNNEKFPIQKQEDIGQASKIFSTHD
ncbi:hypothetical protein T03_10475 [Trichinella britovi]|uniref:Uncharacterized protein n=1 Tax=Trichinella britovi TaxID=45882 RepID=A0A0V1AIB2_TRIBR|nr:hypothetical protein T03_10475 [Trichinella britovi]